MIMFVVFVVKQILGTLDLTMGNISYHFNLNQTLSVLLQPNKLPF
jgi:hypothetical protein